MKILAIIASVLTLAACSLIIVTCWAIEKSRMRTECYRSAQAVSDCAPPNIIERTLRELTGDGKAGMT